MNKGSIAKMDREKIIKEWETVLSRDPLDAPWDLIDETLTLLKEQEWKLITEDSDGILHGLPGDDGQYLMTDGKEIWIDDYVDGVDDGVWLDSGRDVREIKAWMYMPELPKLERSVKWE